MTFYFSVLFFSLSVATLFFPLRSSDVFLSGGGLVGKKRERKKEKKKERFGKEVLHHRELISASVTCQGNNVNFV